MNEILSKLTDTQAFLVLERLAAGDAALAGMIEIEAKRLLMAVDVDSTADEVYDVLDEIAVEDCWDMAGSHRDGYTSPEDAAVELIEAELRPYTEQVERYHELGMIDQERDYCAGIILGLYRYDNESKSEFRNWSEDVPLDSAGCLLDDWRKRNTDKTVRDSMDALIRERCPAWAKIAQCE